LKDQINNGEEMKKLTLGNIFSIAKNV